LENRISKRYILLKDLESLIQESIYYRSFSEDMKVEKKILYKYEDESGKIVIQ